MQVMYEMCSIRFVPLVTAAERTEERKLEEQLLDAARDGDITTLTQLVSARRQRVKHEECQTCSYLTL